MPVLSTLAPAPLASLTASRPAMSSQAPGDATAGPALPTEIFRQIFCIAQASDQDGVDTYLHHFKTALAVSHFSQHWNTVALGQPELWASVSISRGNLDLKLSQVATVDNLSGIDSEFEFWKRLFRPGTNAGKYSTFRRFKLIYVWGGYDEVHSVLKALARCNELTSLARPNPLPIEYLKAMVSPRGEDTNPTPGSLDAVEPFSISRLRSRGIRFFEYPQWAMERIVLEDVEIDTKHIRILVAETGVRSLTLRRVTIPIWVDIDSAHPSAFSLWIRHRDMDSRLDHLELNALVKHPHCTRNLEAHGETAFTLFYEDVFIPDVLRQLKTLKLVNLCRVAWESFLLALHPSGGHGDLVFEAAETLEFHYMRGEEVEEAMQLRIPTSFPQLRMFNPLPIGDVQLQSPSS
ncbi:hypothetical protein FA13DRAFT_1711229 [Coprinellus micaceus]|uniref:Uncharacterized protein n=1 Tax=Coprinellus micaceus TaxID=71717 RepID=A0A4Y7T6Q1_COPMI|nr:hypothetical protein FA13DRAFT_1711229 [Coprinellus micaceus]